MSKYEAYVYGKEQLSPKFRAMGAMINKKVTIEMIMRDFVFPELHDYYDGEMPFVYKDVCKCCIHDEKTASMRIYRHTNSFSCFGCKKGGSPINLFIYFTESNRNVVLEKEDAIRFLYAYYIDDNKSIELNTTKSNLGLTAAEIDMLKQMDKVDENNVELMRFVRVVSKLESMIVSNVNMVDEQKKAFYSMIDNFTRLVNTKKLGAGEATVALKEITLKSANIML